MYVISDHLECGMAPQSGAVSQLGDHSVLKRTSGSATASTFGGVVLARHGTFKICWCGSALAPFYRHFHHFQTVKG